MNEPNTLSALKKMRCKKVCFAGFPTPLQKMPKLSKALGGPNLFIKRDDMTDLAFGGNKARKLEFSFAEAQNQGADIVISTGAVQSNCACMVSAAARRLGMKPVLVLVGKEPEVYDGNLLLDKILSAEIHFIENYGPHVEEYMNNLAGQFRAKGHVPFIIPVGATMSYTVPGYALALQEVINQFDVLEKPVDYIVCTCGTGGTQAGLIFGAKLLGLPTKIVGASVFAIRDDATNNIVKLVNGASKLFDVDITVNAQDVIVFDDYIKEGYGKINNEVTDSLKLVAETEGILLDPIYTGKAMVMLIDLIHKNYFKKTDNVVFFHTGGLPAIFLYKNELQKA
ncbi:MAG: D-cysteine desulfhydrase family protein [Candidatus Bathyarchaeota archaeon]|nr:D-cysteine desulfhydrase family protein [Candidatus Bathyarchaeum tardum]WGM89227.1 MAG: D-cysteine desulfhydrase family protein [Candidatus Bathyarchaeum tardum]WNZ28535.1 MAG: D-cysteine desulfhydrase family protein [Candidatus Bathyarchaeota archaeon]